jgi:hypothetical protein
MTRIILLMLVATLAFIAARAHTADDLSLSISLTRGERSRDSHSQTTRITLKGDELLYEKSYRGRGGARSVPVRKSFRIGEEDRERLKKLIRESNLPDTYELAVPEAESGISRYFAIALNVSLGGKKSSVEISGPRSRTDIREKPAYLKADAVLDAVYKLLAERDKEIGYENRDLIAGDRP